MAELTADDVIRFWFEKIEKSCRFKKDDVFDRDLEQRFGALLARAKSGELDHWRESSPESLALIVVLDQFSRNIFRDSAEAFAADPRALQVMLAGIERGFDQSLTLEQRSFYYLPLRHAEDLAMQAMGLKLTCELNAAGYGTDKYALNHLEIIEQFGRFPHRNRVLGRQNTAAEQRFLNAGNASF